MANAITSVRIVCALALIFFPTFSKWFYTLYIIGGVSDVLDGFAARYLKNESELGAKLDTIADIVFTAVVVIKVFRAIYIPLWLIIWTACIAVIKCISTICGLIINKQFISEHTVMNKICGVLLFSIPICIGRFSWQTISVLIILTCTAATFAAVQEGYYICAGKEVS